MSGPVRPRHGVAAGASAPDNTGAWLIIAGGVVLAASSGVLSVAGALASLWSGRGWVWRAGVDLPLRVARGETPELWPGVKPSLVWGLVAALLALVLATAGCVLALVLRYLHRRNQPARAMATARQVAPLTQKQVKERARQLRPSLQAHDEGNAGEYGVALGRLLPSGPRLYASWEDTLLALMGPRAGKTTALTVPAILEAPGPVVATSVKADVLTDTIRLRRAVGTCWVFDPQAISYSDQDMWWDPLATVSTVEDARRLASHFIQEIAGDRGQSDFWVNAAMSLLTSLILSAGASHGTMRDVWQWLSEPTNVEPVERLLAAGHTSVAAGLRGRQNGAFETRDGIYETARTAAQCLESSDIMRWITPPDRPIPRLDTKTFTATRDTLYLLSNDEAGAARPLVAGLVAEVFHVAQRRAQAYAGRLDPPLLAVLDEAANICRIPNLPQLYSYLGSQGVVPITVLQSYDQGKKVWGEMGMGALWGASTVRVIGAGIADPRLLQDLSTLIGDHDLAVASRSQDARGGTSESVSINWRRILSPEEMHRLPRGQAVIFASGCRPAMAALDAWYAGPNAAAIAAASSAERDDLTERAREEL